MAFPLLLSRSCDPALLFFLSLCSLLFTPTTATAVIPKPNGTYAVNLNTMKLTDHKRVDAFSSNRQLRSIMVSAFYPVGPIADCQARLVEYMPPATAVVEDQYYSQYGLPNGTFESLKLTLCGEQPSTAERLANFPVIIFSPGLGNSRLIYSAMAQSIASQGYLVVTIDHPHDANVVEYPDGVLVFGANIETDAQIHTALETRVQDISFLLDQLSLPSTVRQLLPSVQKDLKTQKVVVFGHSLGGATAAEVMLNDSRVIGGANLDGTFFGPVINQGIENPFLLFGHEGKNQSTDGSWKAIWPHLRGWKIELMLSGAQHATFSDLPLLVKVLGFADVLPPQTGAVLGTLDGGRALKIVSTYLVAFFDFVQKGASSSLLQGPVKAYPEVSIIAK